MNNASFEAFTGYEVRTVPDHSPFLPGDHYVIDNSGFQHSFFSLMEALCYAENVDRARDLSAEALAYFNASGVLVD